MASDMDGRFLVVVAFLIERDSHMLLLKRSMSKDHGLDVTVLGLLDTFHFYRGPAREEAIGIVFYCRATGGDLILSSEHVEAKWVPFEQLQDLACPEWMRRSFSALVALRNPAPLRSP
jgi:hypothetical protein